MELIKYTSYQELAQHWTPKDNLPDSSVVYIAMEHVWDFFLKLDKTETTNKYVVVTSCSDYCVVRQEIHPVWRDMAKWLNFISISEENGYGSLYVPGRVNLETSKITDRYSIKVYSYTNWTFDKIPKQVVKWFCTNCDINDPRVVHIPFGIPDWSYNLISEARERNKHLNPIRPIRVYSNFQLNTLERVAIKHKSYPGIVYSGITQETNEISHEQVIENLLKSNTVLCPSGNGFDCYRNLEAAYCGALPYIITNGDGHWLDPYRKIHINGQLNSSSIADFEWNRQIPLDNTPADMVYWRNEVANAAKLLAGDA